MDTELTEPPSQRIKLRFGRRLSLLIGAVVTLVVWCEVADAASMVWMIFLAMPMLFQAARVTPTYLHLAKILDDLGFEQTDLAVAESDQVIVSHGVWSDMVMVSTKAVETLTPAHLTSRIRQECEAYCHFLPFIRCVYLPLLEASFFLPALGYRQSILASGIGALGCIATWGVLEFGYRKAKARFLRQLPEPSPKTLP